MIKKLYNNIVIIIFHTIVIFALVELTSFYLISKIYKNKSLSKILIKTDVLRYTPHHYLAYSTTPNYKNGKIYHNSQGYRSNEIKKKSNDILRIVTLGGSTTYNESVDDNEKTFTYLMEKMLNKKKANVEVINAGIGGHSSFETLANFQFRVLDIKPDLIILYHGTNDVHTRFVPINLHKGDNSGRRKYWSYINNNKFILNSATFRLFSNWTNDLVNFSPNDFTGSKYDFFFSENPINILSLNSIKYIKRNYENIIAIAKQNSIKVVLVTFASTMEHEHYASWDSYQLGFKQQNEMIKNISKKMRISMIDFEKLMPKDRKYWADGVHLNEDGSKLKAEIFVDFLINEGFVKNYLN
jgi:lysophospholipase L1-like esterase